MIKWISKNKESIIRAAFLVPILSVAIISISHVVSWYNLANPINWAIYLSIAVEIAALSSIAASSVRVKGFSVWFVFIIVTLIQFIGNIYFSYTEININSKEFKDWAELTLPIVSSFSDVEDIVSQRRLLAVLEGGLLPLISLTCLHFFIKYGDKDLQPTIDAQPDIKEDVKESNESDRVWEKVNQLRKEGLLTEPTEDDILNEPSSLANSSYRNEEPQEDFVVLSDSPIKKSTVKIGESPEEIEKIESSINDNSIKRKEVGRGVSLVKRPNDTNNNLLR